MATHFAFTEESVEEEGNWTQMADWQSVKSHRVVSAALLFFGVSP